jgi:hypothetical protein
MPVQEALLQVLLPLLVVAALILSAVVLLIDCERRQLSQARREQARLDIAHAQFSRAMLEHNLRTLHDATAMSSELSSMSAGHEK